MESKISGKAVVAQGNSILAQAAVAAGCRFFAGYPITPATEIAEQMANLLPKHEGVYIQMEDELGSISAVIGAAWNGRLAMTATSGPGFSLMQEALGYAALTETPVVVVDVMRGGPSTGQPTLSSQQDVMQAHYGTHGDYEPIVLCPSSGQEVFDLTIKAFALAEKYRCPVIILTDEIISHSREKVTIPDHVDPVVRQAPKASKEDYLPYKADENGLLDGMPTFGQGYKVVVDGQCHKEDGNRCGHLPDASGAQVNRLCDKILNAEEALTDLVTAYMDDAEYVFFAYGSVARSARSAVDAARKEGLKVGFIQARILWPFPDKAISKYLANAKAIFVPEMNKGKMVREIQRLTDRSQKVISLPLIGGHLHTPKQLLDALHNIVKGEE